MSCQLARDRRCWKRPMRSARNTVPGRAALTQSAWPSSMPSMSVSLTIRLLRCGSSASLSEVARCSHPTSRRRPGSAWRRRPRAPRRLIGRCAGSRASRITRQAKAIFTRSGCAALRAAGATCRPRRRSGRRRRARSPRRAGAGCADARGSTRPAAVLGEGGPLPALAAIHAAVGAVLGAHVDHVRIGRVHRDRLDVHVVRQALVAELPARLAVPAAEHPLFVPPVHFAAPT